MVNCCVPGCSSHGKNKTIKVSYHEIPCNSELREKWLKNISRDNWTPKDRSKVCSLHFLKDNYKEGIKLRQLKPDAVPTIFELQSICSKVRASKNTRRKRPPVGKCIKKCIIVSSECEGADSDKTFTGDSATVEREILTNGFSRNDVRLAEVTSEREILFNGFSRNDGRLTEVTSVSKVGRPPTTPRILRKEVKRLQSQVRYLTSTVSKLRQRLKETKFELKKQKLPSSYKQVDKIEENAKEQDTCAIFLLDQIHAYGTKQTKWSESTLKSFYMWRSRSSRGYEYVKRQQFIKLPGRSTLVRYAEKTQSEVEFNPLIHETLSDIIKQIV